MCTQNNNLCNQCQDNTPCECPITDFSTKCILHDQGNIIDGETIVVENNTHLPTVLQQIVNYLSVKIEEVKEFFKLKNVGTGAEIYAGNDLIGNKKIRKLNSGSNILDITQNADDITFDIDETELNTFIEANQKTYSASSLGGGAEIYKTPNTVVGDNTQFNFRSIESSNGSATITQTANTIDITIPAVTPPDGSETKINSGTTTTKTGTGTTGDPYVIETVNLQKTITYPTDFTANNYNLTSNDNNYVIIVNNGATNVTITVPSGLVSKMQVGFIQKGTGDVTFIASSTTINNKEGHSKIEKQYAQVYLEQELATNTYYLLGNTKV